MQIAEEKKINITARYKKPFLGLWLAGTQWGFRY